MKAQENRLAKYLAVPGAATTLPVSAAKQPFPLAFLNDARAKLENVHYQFGRDHALYYNGHLSELMSSAVSHPNENCLPLEVALNPEVGKQVTFSVKEGEMTLDAYAVHPNRRLPRQGDSPKVDSPADGGLGRNVSGSTRPRSPGRWRRRSRETAK